VPSRGLGCVQPKEVLEQDGQLVALEGCHRVLFSRVRTATAAVDLIVRGRGESHGWPASVNNYNESWTTVNHPWKNLEHTA